MTSRGFWGSYTNSLDSKGRINIPSKIRKNLDREDDETFVLIRGTDPCIIAYPRGAWNDTVQRIKEKIGNGRDFRIVTRRLMYQASEQKVDKQGRLNLPAHLIKYANLNGTITLYGFEDRLEIWNPELYEKFVGDTESDYQELAKDLDF